MCKRRMRTVLIIDDNPAVGEALSLALSLHEIRPLIALTPEQGLAMLDKAALRLEAIRVLVAG